MIRQLIRQIILEDKEENAAIAKKIASLDHKDEHSVQDVRKFGRELKRKWQSEADISSFNKCKFIYWNGFTSVTQLVARPRSKDEISVLPYNSPPFTPLDLGRTYIIGAIVSGHPTIIANADLNSLAFNGRGVPSKWGRARTKSSGWNRYPGAYSAGSSHPNSLGGPGEWDARSWQDHLVYNSSEIAAGEKVSFDTAEVFYYNDNRGWPEALVDNWKVVGLVIPTDVIEPLGGIDVILSSFRGEGVPSGLPIYDEDGKQRKTTR